MNSISKEILDSRLGMELSDKEASKLAGLMQVKELRGGDYLIREGTTDDSLYVIVEGNLEVVKRTSGDSVASIAIVREGQLAGELSFLDSNVHTVGLRALSDSRVLGLAREDFESIIGGAGDPRQRVNLAGRFEHECPALLAHRLVQDRL